MMGALGNALFLVSNAIGIIAPGVSLDFSLVGVFIAGLYGGPVVGFITGLFAGVFPGIFYGPLGSGGWLGLIGLPIGKALTGLTSGLLYKGFSMNKRNNRSIFTLPLVLLSYLPEFLFTIIYFIALLPFFIGGGGITILYFIAPKAWAEIVIMSFLMAALVGNQGFSNFVNNFFAYKKEGKYTQPPSIKR
jgi:LytS/YehU family sensor histidine kinase